MYKGAIRGGQIGNPSQYKPLEYGGRNRAFPFEGTYYLTADGTPERPIAIKAVGDGEVIFDGNGNFTLFNVMAADYTYFEGITFRNTEYAIWAGQQFIAGAKGLTVKPGFSISLWYRNPPDQFSRLDCAGSDARTPRRRVTPSG